MNSKLINLLHIVVVAPLLFLVGTDRLPNKYKKLLVYLAIGVAIFHLFRVMKKSDVLEGQEDLPKHVNGEVGEEVEAEEEKKNGMMVREVAMFDSHPGYDPRELKINVGDVVSWLNIGNVQHTVTGLHDAFHSGYLLPGETFAIKFNKPGTYPYYCIMHHGWMRGVVVVE